MNCLNAISISCSFIVCQSLWAPKYKCYQFEMVIVRSCLTTQQPLVFRMFLFVAFVTQYQYVNPCTRRGSSRDIYQVYKKKHNVFAVHRENSCRITRFISIIYRTRNPRQPSPVVLYHLTTISYWFLCQRSSISLMQTRRTRTIHMRMMTNLDRIKRTTIQTPFSSIQWCTSYIHADRLYRGEQFSICTR